MIASTMHWSMSALISYFSSLDTYFAYFKWQKLHTIPCTCIKWLWNLNAWAHRFTSAIYWTKYSRNDGNSASNLIEGFETWLQYWIDGNNLCNEIRMRNGRIMFGNKRPTKKKYDRNKFTTVFVFVCYPDILLP